MNVLLVTKTRRKLLVSPFQTRPDCYASESH